MFRLLQKVGRSLMLPVSVLPLAGIFLGLGSSQLPGLPPLAARVMAAAGGAVFTQMGLLFALGVALGFHQFRGWAALAGLMGYLVMLTSLGVCAELQGLELSPICGIPSLDTGVFGGIVVGLVVAWTGQKLGDSRAESGALLRSAGLCLMLGAVLSLLWPPLQRAIGLFSREVAGEAPVAAAALWALVNRALIPFGLHHIWNTPFFFQIGDFIDPLSGKAVHGDLPRFYAGDPSAGILGGGYLFALFGLPAASLALIHSARPEERARVTGMLGSAVLTCIVTGITEPVEFTFLFVAPVLYGVHCLLASLGCGLTVALGGKLGFSFSFGLIDYVLLYKRHTCPWLVPLLGPFFALAYYGLFRLLITRFDLATPGRGQDGERNPNRSSEADPHGTMG